VSQIKVLVIGGTKFFGRCIVNQLLDEGHDVTVMSRGNEKPEFFENITHCSCDRTDKEQIAQAVQGQSYDSVIDNIAYDAQQVEEALEVFKGNIGRYIFTSTGALYYTGSMTMPVVESDVNFDFKPPEGEEDSPLWTYTMGKTHAENVLMTQDDVKYTIIRPPIVLGPNDHTLRGHFYFQRLMDGKPLIITNGGVQSFRVVYSEDLAKGYLLAMNSERAVNEEYNIVQQEVVTLKGLIEEAAKALDIEPNIVDIPHQTMKDAGYAYPETYAAMQNFVLSSAKAEEHLGYSSTNFETWIGETVRWFRDSYDGPDSAGYEDRNKELEFAEKYKQANSALKS
jgi:nucleoside-diphosphate-sugar epimerase